MIKLYLSQAAVWKRVTARNEYGEPLTTEANIKVRWEGKRRLVRNTQGQEVVSEARVLCMEPIQAGDLLEYSGRDWPVIAVSVALWLDGTESHREVAV